MDISLHGLGAMRCDKRCLWLQTVYFIAYGGREGYSFRPNYSYKLILAS
jgi:hypothetical protein